MKLITLLRLLVGLLFAGHGAQKLFGWFGGHGLEATAQGFDGMGLKPGKQTAIIAGASEAGGGVLLAAGLATPLAGAAITGTMVQAIRTVHGKNGPWVTNGGWEYNAVLIAAVIAVVEEDAGPLWALGALAAGVIGPEVVTRVLPAGEDEPAPTAPATPAL
jgi:putative oxidoreductase